MLIRFKNQAEGDFSGSVVGKVPDLDQDMQQVVKYPSQLSARRSQMTQFRGSPQTIFNFDMSSMMESAWIAQ